MIRKTSGTVTAFCLLNLKVMGAVTFGVLWKYSYVIAVKILVITIIIMIMTMMMIMIIIIVMITYFN